MSSIKIQQMLFERVVKEFGDDNITMEELVARCSLTDIDMKNMKTPKTLPEEHQCCARIWDKDSDNTRCSKRRIDGKFFCAGHGRPMLNNTIGLEFVWQKCGRIDQPVPKDYRADNQIKKKRKTNKNVELNGFQKPKKPLTGYFCFMNANRQQVKDNNPDDKVGDIAKKLGTMWKSMGEEEKKPYLEMSVKDKERYLKEMEKFNKEKVVNTPKVDEFDKIDINQDGVIDKKEWDQYQAQVEEKKVEEVEVKKVEEKKVEEKKVEEVVENELEENELEEKKVEEKKVEEKKVEEKKVEEVVENELEEEEDDEVTVVEYNYKGNKYLLDPVSKKVYNMEQDFVGKLVGKKKIDFDAVDSDDE